jgi:chaperone required for assembly of F1-ATPase
MFGIWFFKVGGFALTAKLRWFEVHVDEDYQMSQWGLDDMALERREGRFTEFMAAATVLKYVRG